MPAARIGLLVAGSMPSFVSEPSNLIWCRTLKLSSPMKVMKLSKGSSLATKTTSETGLKHNSSARPIPPVEITALVLPVFRSSTLTELGLSICAGVGFGRLTGTQRTGIALAFGTGPSPAQTSVLLPFSMVITPFGPEIVFRPGNEQAPANGGFAWSSLVTTFLCVSTIMISATFTPPLRWNWSANIPWLTETGSHQQRGQPAFSGSHLRGRVSGSDGHFERAMAPGLCRGLWRGVWPDARGASRAPTWPLGSSVDRHDG